MARVLAAAADPVATSEALVVHAVSGGAGLVADLLFTWGFRLLAHSSTVLWGFLAAGFAVAILVVALVAAVVVQQQRFLRATRALGGRLLAAQEEERAWVARELHDDLIQRVALLARELDRIGRSGADALHAEHLEAFRAELIGLGDGIRRLAHRMHPSVLDNLGLAAALRVLGEELTSETGIEVTTELALPETPLRGAVAVCLFRVAQEALRNVIKHAGVRQATLRVSVADGELRLAVEDRGIGFESGRVAAGLGLTSLVERVGLAGGRLAVESTPGAGTTVTARMPIDSLELAKP